MIKCSITIELMEEIFKRCLNWMELNKTIPWQICHIQLNSVKSRWILRVELKNYNKLHLQPIKYPKFTSFKNLILKSPIVHHPQSMTNQNSRSPASCLIIHTVILCGLGIIDNYSLWFIPFLTTHCARSNI